jgi:uncharacterized membrane protein
VNATALNVTNTDAEPQSNVYSGVYHSLVIGMAISTGLFAIGVLLALFRTHGAALRIDPLRANPPGEFFSGLLALDPVAIMCLGTVAMILTPIARVIASIVAFAVDRDYRFVAITSFVLVAIVGTVALGLLGVLR